MAKKWKLLEEFEELTEDELIGMSNPLSRNPFPRIGAQMHHGHAGAKTDTKHSRYRQRQYANGCCPHCGKECAPFYECIERRQKKQINYYLRKMAKEGELICVRRGMYRKAGDITEPESPSPQTVAVPPQK